MFTIAPDAAFDMQCVEHGVLLGKVSTPDKLPWSVHRNSLALYAPSLSAFYGILRDRFNQPRGGRSSSETGTERGWRYFATYDEAFKTYTETPEKIRTFTAKEEELQARNEQGTILEHDVVGDVLDVGLFLEGDPECWGTLSYGNPRGLFAHIYINLSASAFVGGEILSHRNQRVVRLIDWLEHNRVRTRITAVQLTDQDVIEIKIKDYQDGLDLNALAAATHLDFFRRLLFRAKEYGETHGWGYGVPITIYQGRMDTPPKEDDPTVINIYSEIQDSKELLDRQFDEAERFITEHYSDAFIGSESNGDRDHHDPAKGVPDRHQPTPLVWL